MHKLYLSTTHLYTPNSFHMENLSEPESSTHTNESWGILWKFLNKHLMCLNT